MRNVKKLKKAVVLFMAVTCATTIITGCDNKNLDGDERVTIDWLGYQPTAEPDRNSAIVKALEEKYNINLDFWYIDNQKYEELIGVKLASGDMPDVFRAPNLGTLSKYVQQGVAAEITDEMLAMAPSYMQSIADNDTEGNTWIDAKIDGKLYAFKSQTLSGTYPTTLAWRTDWLKNVGIERIPETLDEWEDAMYKFTFNDPDGNGINDTYGMSETTFSPIFGAFGAVPINRFNLSGAIDTFYTKVDGKISFACIQPEMMEGLRLLTKWYKDGVIDPNFITGENTGGYWAISQAFENGRIGVTGNAVLYQWNPPLYEGNNGGAVYQSFMKVNPTAKFGETFDLGKAPMGPTGKSGTQTWGAVSNGGQILTTNATKDQRKIDFLFQFLEDQYSDIEMATLLTYGVEGVTYKKTEEGVYSLLPEFSTPEAQIKAGINVLKVSGGGNPLFSKIWDEKIYEFSDKYKGTGYSNARAPQVPAKAKYIADIQKYTVESYMKIITGEKPIEFFHEYVETLLTKMGGQQIIDETNAEILKSAQ